VFGIAGTLSCQSGFDYVDRTIPLPNGPCQDNFVEKFADLSLKDWALVAPLNEITKAQNVHEGAQPLLVNCSSLHLDRLTLKWTAEKPSYKGHFAQ